MKVKFNRVSTTTSLSRIIIAITIILFSKKSYARSSTSIKGYDILSEQTIFSRWRSIISRVVKIPTGHVVDYDVGDYVATNIQLNIDF